VSVFIDASAFIAWEKGEFDLPAWAEARPDEPILFPPTAWQELLFGKFAWEKARAEKRGRFLAALAGLEVSDFGKPHAERAARLAADLRRESIGIADFQIAACVLEEGAELLTFNIAHFSRIPGLRLAKV